MSCWLAGWLAGWPALPPLPPPTRRDLRTIALTAATCRGSVSILSEQFFLGRAGGGGKNMFVGFTEKMEFQHFCEFHKQDFATPPGAT